MTTRNNDVETICPSAEPLSSEAQVAALESLRNEIKQDTSTMNSDQAREYMWQLTQKLQESNQLPELSLVYADQLGADLNRADLRNEMRSVNRDISFGENDKQLDKAFIRFLLDNYEGGANLIESVDEEPGYDSNISRADIAAKLAQFRSSAQTATK